MHRTGPSAAANWPTGWRAPASAPPGLRSALRAHQRPPVRGGAIARNGAIDSLAGLAGAAALSLALWLAMPATVPAPLVIVLQATPEAAASGNAFVASVSGDGRALMTRPPQPVALQPGRLLELWSVLPQGAPRSLGLVSAQGVRAAARAA
jgi:anti-sigma-K factor RskA